MIDVPTPDGTVEMNVPAGSQTGRKLRLRGRGIPAKVPGDLYMMLELVLPPAIDEKGRAAYRQMANPHGASAAKNWRVYAASAACSWISRPICKAMP